MRNHQLQKNIIHLLGFSLKIVLCALGLVVAGGCAVNRGAPSPKVDFSYRSELAAPQAKAFYAYSQYRLLAAENRWDEAIAALERAVVFDPDNAYLQMNLAKALLHKDDIGGSVKLLQQLLLRSPQNIEAHELLGDLLSYQGDQAAAILHYRQALELNPDSEMLQMRLAMALGRQGQNDEAIQVLLALVAKHPEAQLARLALARSYRDNQQPEQAKQIYLLLLAEHPDQQQAILEYGKLLESEQLSAEAYQLYRDAINRNPRLAAVRQQLAMLYLHQHRLQEALEQFEAIHRQFPDNLEMVGKIGLIHLEQQNWSGAEEEFRLLLERSPDDDRYRYYLGMALIGQGRRDEAIEIMTPIRETAPIFTEAVLQLAYLYQQAGQVQQAVAALRKLLAMEIREPEIYYYLATFLEDAGDLGAAGQANSEGLENFPEDVNLLYQQGVIYEKLGDHDQALEVMQKVLQLQPNHPDALNFVAYQQAESGEQLDLALSRAKQALSAKKAGYIIDTLGWIYFKMGRYQESREQLEEASSLHPDDPVILEHLGDLYRALTLWEKAAAAYRKALEMDPQAEGLAEKLDGLPKPPAP